MLLTVSQENNRESSKIFIHVLGINPGIVALVCANHLCMSTEIT